MPKAPASSSFGDTHVLCVATVEERVPPFLRNTGKGWVTAEYGMLPRSTNTRTAARGRPRQAVRPHPGDPAPDRPLAARRDPARRPGRAPGDPGLRRAPGRRRHAHRLDHRRLRRPAPRPGQAGRSRRSAQAALARARGRGVLRHRRRHGRLDLDYVEDSGAQADANFVLSGSGGIVEVQVTAEDEPDRRSPVRGHARAGAPAGSPILVALQRQTLGC